MGKINTLDQNKTFCFYLVTRMSIEQYFFDWDKPNHELHIKMLNTICGWKFLQGWKDQEYKFPTGKAIRMSAEIKKDAKLLRDSFLAGDIINHKSRISSLYKTLSTVKDGELFFIYRVVYTLPSQRLLSKILNELIYINNGKSKEDADVWFDNYAATFFNEYDVRYYSHAKIGERERTNRICRFCGKSMPAVKFEKVAHVVPESIGGSKNLICYEECDECNAYFGEGVERNLCEWFDFRRSTHQVKKKSGGIPKAYGRNYVVEDGRVSVILDKDAMKDAKLIGSGTVTLQGIYRALCKIAIDLIDKEYLEQLKTTIKWIRFGYPKSSRYPQIAQMHGLCDVKEPMVYICTRKDGCDTENTPLHFCILRIFDLAFLYVLPHVNGRMVFQESYTKNIPTEALKVLGFTESWDWESYDTTEERNPHVEVDFSNVKMKMSNRNGRFPIEKIRREQKPKDSIGFKKPIITATDINNRNLEYVQFTHTDNKQSVSGNITVQAVVDLSQRIPLFVRLNIAYKDMRSSAQLATIVYSAQISPTTLYQQMKLYNDESYSLNQDLFVCILEYMLEYLYMDILARHTDFPYNREMLYINNVRELLNDMKLFLTKDGCVVSKVEGRNLWQTGY
ncbi:MAG: HNH endonuclease [Muribaculaceae bacterium]